MPKCKSICGNRIYTIEPQTIELIVEILKNVQYLDVSLNAIATYSFINNVDLWCKFIFIYESHLE